MNRKLIVIDLGENRIEMHERPAFRYIESEHRGKRSIVMVEEVFGKFLDTCRMRAFADPYSQQMLIQNQNISAFDGGRKGAFVIERKVLLTVVRVVFENIIAVNRFAASG